MSFARRRVRGQAAGETEAPMTYTLAIGDRSYSSWSLRAWLVFEKAGIPVAPVPVPLDSPAFAERLAPFAPARTVPALRIEGVGILWDTLAIIETLAERHPESGIWPRAPGQRGLARAMVAEMHAGFAPLRSACPMNLRTGFAGFEPSLAVRADLERIEALWAAARAVRDPAGGTWLFGAWSAPDAFFAPVAARIAAYGLPVGPQAAAYVTAQLADPPIRRWRAEGIAERRVLAAEELDLSRRPWPGPATPPARSVTDGTAVNATCPFTGAPARPDGLAEIAGRVIGFCSPFCRDKAVADAGAWPELAPLIRS
jgi:glutathione S-transferase